MGQLFHDAGGDYILANETGGGDTPLDFETVYDRVQNAEFWINLGYSDDVNSTLTLDPRNTLFDAYKSDRIYHYNARVNAYGGNDYWQSGVVHPDIVLEDLVKILHPELLPDHELYYYRHIVVNQTGGSV